MAVFSLSPTRGGVLLCSLMIIICHFHSAEAYSAVAHPVSQLGAQSTPGRWWMSFGFLALGVGTAIDARRLWWTAPFVSVIFTMFAIAVTMMAVCAPRPISSASAYSDMWHLLHAVFAAAASLCFCIGAVGYGVFRRLGPAKWISIGVGVCSGLLWLAAFTVPDLQGVLQRLMYTLMFVWLAVYLPSTPGKTSSGFARTPWFASNR